MGWSGSSSQTTADGHNQPAILIDSQKYLHYISGAHGHKIWHRKSLSPVTNNSWNNNDSVWAGVAAMDKFSPGPLKTVERDPADSELQAGVDYIGNPQGGYTYVQPRIDSNDNIHLTMRDNVVSNGLAGYRLTYIQGSPQGNGNIQWKDKGTLVEPNWKQYSNYTQNTHLDNEVVFMWYIPMEFRISKKQLGTINRLSEHFIPAQNAAKTLVLPIV